jgi:hypothetical protein
MSGWKDALLQLAQGHAACNLLEALVSTPFPRPGEARQSQPQMPHKTPYQSRLTPLLTLAGAALALALAGCMERANDEMTNAIVSGEKSVAMEGSDVFLGGRVAVRVTLGRGIGHGMKRGKGEQDATYRDYTDTLGKTLVGSPLPPVTIHLILSNPGTEAVTVTVLDFASDLGDFAVDPDTLTIAPGQTGEPTAMVSHLGVSSDEMPFKVTLRVGKEKDTRTFLVKALPPPPAAK